MNRSLSARACLVLYLVFLFSPPSAADSTKAPIFDLDNESVGYSGTVGEHSVIVELKPHLQIKNIDDINGICSYHVFKSSSQHFPFTIDIIDKSTGEAIIQAVRKDPPTTPQQQQQQEQSQLESAAATVFNFTKSKQHGVQHHSIVLDCNKNKEFNFLLQAYDCSDPPQSSKKVPINIRVVDFDDFQLKFERDVYTTSLVESTHVYKSFMQVKATDGDCTNNGMACAYALVRDGSTTTTLLDSSFAFAIDNNGWLSSTRAVSPGESFSFKVRAFDCVTKDSYVETSVFITISEKCMPHWTGLPKQVNVFGGEESQVLASLFPIDCKTASPTNDDELDMAEARSCGLIESVDTHVTIMNKSDICNNKNGAKRRVLKSTHVFYTDFDLATSAADSSSSGSGSGEETVIGSDQEEMTVDKLQAVRERIRQQVSKSNTFSKWTQNRHRVDLAAADGKFGDEFKLSFWLRKKLSAEKTSKQHLLCATDSKLLNRHHFGVYFQQTSLKLLLRKERNEPSTSTSASTSISDQQTKATYPSLWEWKLSEPVVSDEQWHLYEIEMSYPKASLSIDGVLFVANTTNSETIEANEFSETFTADILTYVGACYHAKTDTFQNYLEGDVAEVQLKTYELLKDAEQCTTQEDDFISSSDSSLERRELWLHASSLDEMAQKVKQVKYVNKMKLVGDKDTSRSISLLTNIKCVNELTPIAFKELTLDIVSMKKPTPPPPAAEEEEDDEDEEAEEGVEAIVQLAGSKHISVVASDLKAGIQPFQDIYISASEGVKGQDKTQTDDHDDDDDDGDNGDDVPDSTSSSSSSSIEISQGNVAKKATSQSPATLSSCTIEIFPKRNLLEPSVNAEKVMFFQNLLDYFGFKFEETRDSVKISGVQTFDNYEFFIRRLTYIVTNIDKSGTANNIELIRNKTFALKCFKQDKETNTIRIELDLITRENVHDAKQNFIALKQVQKLIVDDDVDSLSSTLDISKSASAAQGSAKSSFKILTNPIVLCVVGVCASVFLVGVVLVSRRRASSHSGQFKRINSKQHPNEENPQMEWDDTSLNIIENPLDAIKSQNSESYELDENDRGGEGDEGEEEDEDYLSSSSDEAYADDNVVDTFDASEQECSDQQQQQFKKELEWDNSVLMASRDKLMSQQQQQQYFHQNTIV